GWPVGLALPFVLLVALGIGLFHGVLVTGMKLQPFVVTLCGLLLYRGIMRGITNDQTAGLGSGMKDLQWLANGEIPIAGEFGLPVPFLILAVVATLAAILLNRSVFVRHLLALG